VYFYIFKYQLKLHEQVEFLLLIECAIRR